MAGWTRFVIRNRRKFLVGWLIVAIVGGAASAGLADILTSRFSVPGSQAERGRDILKHHFGEQGNRFTLVVAAPAAGNANSPAFLARAQAAAERAAKAVKGGHAGPMQAVSPTVASGQIITSLDNVDAAKRTPAVRRAIGTVPGARTYVTGFPAISHDTNKIFAKDLVRGESIAIPIALVVLVFMLGTLAAIAVPFAFAFASIPATLGLVFVFAHLMAMANYVQNIVTLIGLAIAIDYSMLVVYRFREELAAGRERDEALVNTMRTAGRATVISGFTVALGLGLLILMPLPFMQSMGVGGILVPLVSIAAGLTLLPALLAALGPRVNRLRVVPKRVLERRVAATSGAWARLAHSIMRRPVVWLIAAASLMIVLALPALAIRVTGGDNRGSPTSTEATRGLALMTRIVGAGALSPDQIMIDTGRPGGAWSARMLAAERELAGQLRGDQQVDPGTVNAPSDLVSRPGPPPPRIAAAARKAELVDSTGRYVQIQAAGRQDIGTTAASDLVHRIRNDYVPSSGFGPAKVNVSGAPAFNVDFIHRAYQAFPWLVLAVLVLSYLLLARAFRSVVIPVKAVLLNLLSVSAAYGVMVLIFQDGWGKHLGFHTSPQIEGWIPIFVFAMTFGLSMDYEVFLISRMREEWDRHQDNEQAVALGLEHTGRIITAAAIIMIAAFSGFTAGSFPGLQMFGVGISAAIFLDATVVRVILVPATMKLLGKWNWYMPERVGRWLRIRPPELTPDVHVGAAHPAASRGAPSSG